MTVKQEGQHHVTELLREWTDGRAAAMDELLPYIYNDLHRRAAAYLRHERINHTLQPTALVHEAYIRLIDQDRVEWKSRGHFFAVAAQAMRRILVDHAKHRHREKRGGALEDARIDDGFDIAAATGDIDLEALDEALTRLAAIDPEHERLVELRYFAGLSLEDTAAAMDISRATAAREWQLAKAWLYRELTR
jgi:RNA polymerase sigma factor (TIGR02999 family)